VDALIPRGTLLNTATVAIGGLIGWALSSLAASALDQGYHDIVFSGLGIVTIGIGLKMLLGAKNVLVVAAAIALGGVLGKLMGIHESLEGLAEWMKQVLGAKNDQGFVSIMVGTSVLFCVGPMTLLGCIQERLENKIELLSLKSTMDGVGSIFFGAISGPAVLATAGVVLVFQSLLTFAAKPLKPMVDDEDMLADLSGAGGVMLVATGLGLLVLNKGPALRELQLPVSNYLPSLVLAPLFVLVGHRLRRRTA
jgi:uncharacterized membrane protein YqgA involved in biofilm formation